MIKIATWNMCYLWHRNRFENTWNHLIDKINPDIALVQESIPSKIRKFKNFLWNEIGGNCDWGSGILSRYPIEKIEFENSFKGSVIAGEVTLPSGAKITIVSVYAKFEGEYSIIPLHRIFSDLTLLLDGKLGKRDIILGGDFNASLQFDKQQPGNSHKIFFERVKNFGLIDCLEKFYDEPVQTFRHRSSKKPWQIDYLFVSKRLSNTVKDCKPIQDSEIISLSDHNPVILNLNI